MFNAVKPSYDNMKIGKLKFSEKDILLKVYNFTIVALFHVLVFKLKKR